MGRFGLVGCIVRRQSPANVEDGDARGRFCQGAFHLSGEVQEDAHPLGGLRDVEALFWCLWWWWLCRSHVKTGLTQTYNPCLPTHLRADVDVEAAEPRVATEAGDDLLPVGPNQVDAELGREGADAQLGDAPGPDQGVDAQADGGFWMWVWEWGGAKGREERGDAVQLLEGVGVEVDAVAWVGGVCLLVGFDSGWFW